MLLLILLIAYSCQKEQTIVIPVTLDKTVWTAIDDSCIRTAAFGSETCEITTEYIATDSETKVTTYSYIYNYPTVELTNTEDADNIWSGKIVSDEKSYLMIILHNADNSESISMWSDYNPNDFWKQ